MERSNRLILTLAILGGTGREGGGLAYRWAKAGYHVVIGSRKQEKAERAAEAVNARLEQPSVRGMTNDQAAADCDIAVLTVPYAAHRDTLESLREPLRGKIVIDVTVPIDPQDPFRVSVPPEGSAAQEAQGILGDSAPVVAAFQNVSHSHLREDGPVPCDVLVCGDDEEAKAQVLRLVAAAGLVGWDAGALRNAVAVEGLSPILLGINRRHKVKSAGLRITGEQQPG
jgi:NADPH-dependent F420 reductase